MATHTTEYSEKFRARIVLPLCFTIFFSVLNGTMFNVAVPDIARQFVLSPAAVSWVLTGYIVVFALAAVIYGKLADLYPVRNLITAGLLLFNSGALCGYFSDWYPMLVGARLLQASGGGAIPALGMLVATRYFPEELRGRVLGALAATVAFAAGVGPVVGGFIAGTWHWRYLFLLSLATLVSIPLFRRLLPVEEPEERGFDLRGAVLLAGAVGTLLVFVAQRLAVLLPVGLVLLAGFILRIRRAEKPFVSPSLFANRYYRSGLLTTFAAVGTVFGMFFQVPVLLRHLNALDTWHIGLVIFPGALSASLLGRFGGRLADRRGGEAVVLIGLGLLCGGYLLLAAVAGGAAWTLSPCLVVCYTGFSFIQSSLAKTVSTHLPPERIGVGMGFYNLTFFTSGAFGAAFVGMILDLFAEASSAATTAPLSAGPYRLVFLLQAATVCGAAGFFRWVFRRGETG